MTYMFRRMLYYIMVQYWIGWDLLRASGIYNNCRDKFILVLYDDTCRKSKLAEFYKISPQEYMEYYCNGIHIDE